MLMMCCLNIAVIYQLLPLLIDMPKRYVAWLKQAWSL